jgi:hypothetical protein
MAENVIYGKLLDVLIVLKDEASYFIGHSARDLVKLIEAASHNKKRDPEGIRRLYELENRIREVRLLLEQEKCARIVE